MQTRLQVLIRCYHRQLIYSTNVEGNRYFWYPFEHEWSRDVVVSRRRIKKGQHPDEASRHMAVITQEGTFDMYYEA